MRVRELVTSWGVVGLVLYLTSTCLVYFAFLIGLRAGWKPSGFAAAGGVWVAAYVGTKVTQPFRIAGVIAVTPMLTNAYARLRRLGREARQRPADPLSPEPLAERSHYGYTAPPGTPTAKSR